MEPPKNSFGFLFADVFRLMRRTFQQRLEGCGLTFAQARALLNVARNEGVRQVDLAELLEVQPITLARLIDQLVDAGLIERRPSPTDRRAYLIYLTQAAAPHLATIEKIANSIRDDALRGLDERQVGIIFFALRKMRDNLASG
ncbi:MAG: MarR family winged helix-turn-helix transcriptional regulator [Sulfuricellaceae bacterium]